MRSVVVGLLGVGLLMVGMSACSASGSSTYEPGSSGTGGAQEDGSVGGSGGTGASGGAGGTGGTGGQGGTGGSGATGGSGGAAGASGAGGTGGQTGDGGAAGLGGSGGAAGTAGDGGAAGQAGTGGAAGTGGVGGSGGTGGGGTGVLGDPCTSGAQCISGECVEGPDGDMVCSQKCVDTCPDEWRCATIQGSSDPGGYCVPRFSRLCRPCDDDDACRLANVPSESGRCISRGADGSFCGATCSTTEPCPAGYFCDTIDIGGVLTKQCVPENDAECMCQAGWAGKGYSTTCYVQNGYGTCHGTRDCDTGSLSACDATTPAQEACDGQDNDCNGLVDDGSLCDDGLLCTTDSCGGASGCANQLVAGSCQIGFACYASGDTNPSNPCQSCAPANSQTSWTTQTNSCAIGGACYGALAANPSASCQICNPNVSTTAWSVYPGQCYIGGTCYNAGDANAGNACQTCQPNTSQTTWSALPNSCAIGGGCYANGAVNPALSCQVCNTAVSTTEWSVASGRCYIGGTCYSNGDTKTGDVCWACLASSNPNNWSANTDASCNDGTACTTSDMCQSDGTCSGTLVQDGNEPNDTAATATALGNMTDCDSTAKTGTGRLSGQADSDWYTTWGDDTFGCTVDPAISTSSGGVMVTTCVYFKCDSGETTIGNDVNCQGGSTSSLDSSLPGYAGCCESGINPAFNVSLDCDGSDDNATMKVRIFDLSSSYMCQDFSFQLHY